MPRDVIFWAVCAYLAVGMCFGIWYAIRAKEEAITARIWMVPFWMVLWAVFLT
jgi:hypothetical protein